VSSTLFINEFFKLGKIERENAQHHNLVQTQRIQEFHDRLKKKRAEKLKSLNDMALPTTCTEQDEISALAKFSAVAFKYERDKSDCLQV
jgi:hypothetical protein